MPSKDDPWVSRDKYFHAASSAIIGAIATQVARAQDAPVCDAFRIGFSVTTSVGFLKEWVDQDIRHRGWSWRDLAWDVAGGSVGSLLVSQCW